MENLSSENGGRPSNPVACPRCQSLNTKFCYYNNHNVNQPRHFCRDCQRYWTAGGSLRNVPVGAGKRKHKGPLPSTVPPKMENLPNIFCFSGTQLDQGVYTPTLNSSSGLSLKQHAVHSHGESKPLETTTPASQSAFIGVAKPMEVSAEASYQVVPGNHGVQNASGRQDAVWPPAGSEKIGFSDATKKPSLALGLTLSKHADAKLEDHVKPPLHANTPCDFTSLRHGSAVIPPQYATELDESTGCSSVTANLGPSAAEAFAESKTPSTRAPTLPSVDQAPTVLNPMTAAWGASMCPPWLWPFIMNSRNIPPPAAMPQLDPTFAAAMSAMASTSPIHPAFAAAMGAMASGGSLPQVDPNVMAALTATFLQLPHLWNPYTWSLPWNAAWNMAAAGGNIVANGVNKRPASPTQEQGCAAKVAKKDHTDEPANSHGAQTSDVANPPKVPAGCFEAFHSKQLKATATLKSEGGSDLHQHQSPHTNPAAQARSAAFQEGN